MIGSALDEWGKMDDMDVAVVAVGEDVTIFQLESPRAFVLVDVEDVLLPVCNSRCARLSSALASLRPSTITDGSDLLSRVMKILRGIRDSRSICLTLFASKVPSDAGLRKEFREFLKSGEISMHLFAPNTLKGSKMLHLFDRIRTFELDCAHLIAPQLLNWLSPGFLFNCRILLCSPPCFSLSGAWTTRQKTSSRNLSMTCLDSQTAVSFELAMRRNATVASLCFQTSIIATTANGARVIRVINWRDKVTHGAIERIDPIVFGSFMARRRAYEAYDEGQGNSYCHHRNACVDLITAWSAEGQYLRSIPVFLRDLPLLLFAIEVCDLYSWRPGDLLYHVAMVNLMGFGTEEIRRVVYPVMIIPPLRFCHRLQRSSLPPDNGFVILINAFEGIACGSKPDLEALQEISAEYDVPITLYDDPKPMENCLVEDRFCTFRVFAGKLEVDVNGRRF
jgi:hypothetical protein